MKRLFVLMVMISLFACGNEKKSGRVTAVDPETFAAQMKLKKDFILLDVRTPEEVQSGILPGSINIDHNAEGFEQRIDSLDHDKTYFVYCASGKRSGRTIELMKEKGFKDATSLKGGLNAWKQEGHPVQKN